MRTLNGALDDSAWWMGVPGERYARSFVREVLVQYSDFWYRELDAIVGTALYAVLLLLSFLPISHIHAKLLFNVAFASDLAMVNRRRQLIDELYSRLILRASCGSTEADSFGALQRAMDEGRLPGMPGLSLSTQMQLVGCPDWIKVVVVRDPLERLLSGYLDKCGR